MELPDTLSRAQLICNTPELDGLESVSMLNYVAVSEGKYNELQECAKRELTVLQHVIQQGQPEHSRDVPVAVQP